MPFLPSEELAVWGLQLQGYRLQTRQASGYRPLAPSIFNPVLAGTARSDAKRGLASARAEIPATQARRAEPTCPCQLFWVLIYSPLSERTDARRSRDGHTSNFRIIHLRFQI